MVISGGYRGSPSDEVFTYLFPEQLSVSGNAGATCTAYESRAHCLGNPGTTFDTKLFFNLYFHLRKCFQMLTAEKTNTIRMSIQSVDSAPRTAAAIRAPRILWCAPDLTLSLDNFALDSVDHSLAAGMEFSKNKTKILSTITSLISKSGLKIFLNYCTCYQILRYTRPRRLRVVLGTSTMHRERWREEEKGLHVCLRQPKTGKW